MRLEGADGSSLELHLVGYQFGGMTAEPGNFDWDANWLVVDARASDGERSWHFRDPCLLTIEARDLAAWLDAVADARPDLDATDFMEPNLEFRRVSAGTDLPVVRVTFRLGARPPWAQGTSDDDWDAAWLEFATSPDALRTAARDLRAELAQYPMR